MRGYFEIGIVHGKAAVNVGALWRSAQQLGAAGVFTVGRRYDRQASDVLKSWRHVPVRNYSDLDDLIKHMPLDCWLVGVEVGGKRLRDYCHPERAVYLLGAEDNGLPASAIARCRNVVSLESVGPNSYNVAVAGSLVMYDRVFGR